MIELVKSVAESNGLKVTETPTLMQIAGPQPAAETRQSAAQQLLAQQLAQNQQQQVRLFTYRLKHASAVQLAPVLTNLFSGLTGNFGGRGTTIIPNANGGFQVFTPANPAGGPPGQHHDDSNAVRGESKRGTRRQRWTRRWRRQCERRRRPGQRARAGRRSLGPVGRHPHHRRGIEQLAAHPRD
jgi:hypothetical protein